MNGDSHAIDSALRRTALAVFPLVAALLGLFAVASALLGDWEILFNDLAVLGMLGLWRASQQ